MRLQGDEAFDRVPKTLEEVTAKFSEKMSGQETLDMVAKSPEEYTDDVILGWFKGTPEGDMAAAMIAESRTPEGQAKLIKVMQELAKDPELTDIMMPWMMGKRPTAEQCASPKEKLLEHMPEPVWCIGQGT